MTVMKKKIPFLARFLVLWLTFCLGLPTPALALRDLNPVEKGGTEEDLRRSFQEGRPFGQSRAGMEQDQVQKVVEQSFKQAPAAIKAHLAALFESKINYLKNPDHLEAFKRRFKKFDKQIYRKLDPRLFSATNEFYRNVLFLMIARGTIKDLVWQFGEEGRIGIEKEGGRPTAFFNLFDAAQAESVLERVLREGFFKDTQGLSDDIEWQTGYSLKAFFENKQLFEIFADQIIDALRISLDKRKRQFSANDPNAALIGTILDELRSDTRGEVEFLLTNRGIDFLRGGDRAGDCTASGSFNAWTAASWTAVFENFELEAYHRGDFFARFIVMVGNSGGKLTLWIHALEFTPLARAGVGTAKRSRFSDPALQKEILLESLKFILAFSRRGGANEVYLTGISNSFGFVDILTGLLKSFSDQTGIRFESRPFRLLNGLHSAHAIRDLVEGPSEQNIGIYLQGWQGPAIFARTTAPATEEARKSTVSFAGKDIDQVELDRASRLFMQMIQDRLGEEQRKVNRLDYKGFQEMLEEAILAENPEQALHRMSDEIRQSAQRLTELFDPGAMPLVERALVKSERDLERKGKKLGGKRPAMSAEWEKLIGHLVPDIYGLRKRLRRVPSKEDVEIMIGSDRFYEGRVPPGIQFFKILIESMPLTDFDFDHPEKLDQVEGLWKNKFSEGLFVERMFEVNRFFGRRPSELKQLHERFDSLLRNLTGLVDVQGEGLMAVMNRLDPGLAETFHGALRDGGYSEESVRLMMEHPAEVVDYYISVSRSTGTSTGSLLSQVNTLALGDLFPDAAGTTPVIAAGVESAGVEENLYQDLLVENRDPLPAYSAEALAPPAAGMEEPSLDSVRKAIERLNSGTSKQKIAAVKKISGWLYPLSPFLSGLDTSREPDEALHMLGRPLVTALIQTLRSDDLKLRFYGIGAIEKAANVGIRPDRLNDLFYEAAPLLADNLNHENMDIRDHSANALEAFAEQGVVFESYPVVILAVLANLYHPNDGVKVTNLLALNEFAELGVAEPLFGNMAKTVDRFYELLYDYTYAARAAGATETDDDLKKKYLALFENQGLHENTADKADSDSTAALSRSHEEAIQSVSQTIFKMRKGSPHERHLLELLRTLSPKAAQKMKAALQSKPASDEPTGSTASGMEEMSRREFLNTVAVSVAQARKPLQAMQALAQGAAEVGTTLPGGSGDGAAADAIYRLIARHYTGYWDVLFRILTRAADLADTKAVYDRRPKDLGPESLIAILKYPVSKYFTENFESFETDAWSVHEKARSLRITLSTESPQRRQLLLKLREDARAWRFSGELQPSELLDALNDEELSKKLTWATQDMLADAAERLGKGLVKLRNTLIDLVLRKHQIARQGLGQEEIRLASTEARAGDALGQLRLEAVVRTGHAHILYDEAGLAALFFLHYRGEYPSPNVAVVDPLRHGQLRAIAEAAGKKAGWTQEQIDAWDETYVVAYIPGDSKNGIGWATQEAEQRIAERLPGVPPLLIFTLPDVFAEFGAKLKAHLDSFGLSFQSGTLMDQLTQFLYEAAQA